MHLNRERLLNIEELQQESKTSVVLRQVSHEVLRRFVHDLPNCLSFQRSRGDEAGMIVSVAEQPGFTDRAITRKRSRQHVGQTPAAPGSILVNRLEAQWIKRYVIHLFPFHCGRVSTTPRRAIALGSVGKSVLRQKHVRLLASPNLQSRLLNGTGKGERESPGKTLSEPNVHCIQPGRSEFTGLAAGQKRDCRNRC